MKTTLLSQEIMNDRIYQELTPAEKEEFIKYILGLYFREDWVGKNAPEHDKLFYLLMKTMTCQTKRIMKLTEEDLKFKKLMGE